MLSSAHSAVAAVQQVAPHIPFIKILILALYTGFMGVDMQNFYTHLHRPVVSGLVVGLLLGNVPVGLVAGASIELAFLGLVPVAGSQPPNPVLAGVLGPAFAIMMHMDPRTVVGFVVPFAVVMSVLIILLYTAFAFLSNRADSAADQENYSEVARQPIWGLIYLYLLYFVMALLPLMLGAGPAKHFIDKIPQFIIGGLTLAGGAMPAVGFALLLTIMLRKEYVAYLALGFVLASYLHLPATAIAILAVSIAAIEFFIRRKAVTEVGTSVRSTSSFDDDEEGI